MRNEYRYESKDVAAFISQVVRYVSSGHYFYVRCVVPEHKDPHEVARKLISRYRINRKRWERKRRHLKQTASIHYLACGRVFVLMLTKGEHRTFYEDHAANVLDIRRQALKVFGYSVRYSFSEIHKDWKVFVRLDAETYRKIKAHLLTVSVWDSYRDAGRMEREFHRLPYQSYGPVYEQLLSILKQVNRERRRRGFATIAPKCIRRYRRLGKVFVEREEDSEAA